MKITETKALFFIFCLIFIAGFAIAYDIATESMQHQAIKAGVAKYVFEDTNSTKVTFKFITK